MIKRGIIFVFILGAVFGSSFFIADAYSPDRTHAPLGERAVELFNYFYPDKKLSEQEKRWIAQGANNEDNSKTRTRYHFYDPVYQRGLEQFASSKEWAQSKLLQASSLAGSHTWQDALASYAKGDRREAFIKLGHIFHLIQDATVPAHTRQDSHIPFPSEKDADPYEKEAVDFEIPALQTLLGEDMRPIIYNDLNNYFDKTANFTNRNFYSKDSITRANFPYDDPSIESVGLINDAYYGIGVNKQVLVKFSAPVSKYSLGIDFNNTQFKFDTIVNRDNWNHLSREAIKNTAGLINLFLEQAEQQESPKTGFFGKIGGFFGDIGRTFFSANIKVFNVFLSALDKGVRDFVLTSANNLQEQRAREKLEARLATLPVVLNGADPTSTSHQGEAGQPTGSRPQSNSPREPALTQEPQSQSQSQLEPDPKQQQKQLFTVTRVIDGDTVELVNGERVRLIGVDAPELSQDGEQQCFAQESQKFLSGLILNQQVALEEGPDDKDKYDRLLRYIWRGDELINQTTIKTGHARAFDFGFTHKFTDLFEGVENQAKSNGRGLWTTCQNELQEELEISQTTPVPLPLAPKQNAVFPLVIDEVSAVGAEFVELYNPTGHAISLSEYYFAYYSSNSVAWNNPYRVKQFLADAVIDSYGYFVIGLGNYTAFSNWQPYATSQLSDSAGTVALYVGDPRSGGGTYIDAFGWGGTNLYESRPYSAWFSANSSASRDTSHTDTDNNFYNFSVATYPSPGANFISQGGSPAPSLDDGDGEEETPPSAQIETALVINEVQTQGSEFVELYNPTDESVPLLSYNIVYYSATKQNWTDPHRTWTFPDDASIAAQSYFVVDIYDYISSYASPTADWQVTTNTGDPYASGQLAASGTLALYANDPSDGGTRIDAVAWGVDDDVTLKEIQTAIEPGQEKTISRDAGHTDSNNNSSDFILVDTPTPGQNYSAPQSDITPPSVIEDFSAESGIVEGSVQLIWTASGDDGNTGSATAYILKYSEEEISAETWDAAQTYAQNMEPQAAGEQELLTVQNLNAGTFFYFAIMAIDDAQNLSAISNIASAEAQGASQPYLLINEVQVADGEFIELYNPTGDTIELNDYYFAYYSSSQTVWSDPLRLKAFPNGAAIDTDSFYLIGLSAFLTRGGNPNADWQPYTSMQLSNTSGTIAIFNSDPTQGELPVLPIDAVAWGDISSNLKESEPSSAPPVGQSISRDENYTDSDNNSADFTVGESTPVNSSGDIPVTDLSGTPIWAAYQGNSQHTGVSSFSGPAWTSSEQVLIASSTSVVSGIASTMTQPLIDSQGNLYFALYGAVYSYNSLGQLRWSYISAQNDVRGIALSADSSRLYVSDISFAVIKTLDGTLIGTSSIAANIVNGSPTIPVVDNNTNNAHVVTLSKIFAIDQDANVFWEKSWGTLVGELAGGQLTRVREPLLYNGKLYVLAEATIGSTKWYLFEINASDGTLNWYTDMEQGAITDISGAPSINSQGVIFVSFGKFANPEYGIAVFDSATQGTLKWTVAFADSPMVGAPVIGPTGSIYVFVSGTKTIHKLVEADDGLSATINSFVTISANIRGFAADANERMYISDAAGNIIAFDSAGNTIWQYNLGAVNARKLSIGDGAVYIATDEIKLYNFSD